VDARYAKTIQAQIARLNLTNVRLLGNLADEALARTLARSDVLAVPSEYEGFGIVYLEGMSFGLPAIASAAGAACEIISDGENGFLVAPNDVDTLAARLSELQRDRARLVRMSLAARARFLAHPTWDASMARVRAWLGQ
jgi:glycosyltransferase involved in cell wall biosynthesis